MDFKEEQSLNILFVKIIFGFSALASIAGLSFYLFAAIRDGNELPNMIIVPVSLVIAFGIAYMMIFRTRLETSISASGFSYKFFPFILKARTISFNEISGWKIKPFTNIFNYGGYGYRRNLFSKKITFIFNKSDVLELHLTNGKSVFVSTLNEFNMNTAMRKYAPLKEMK